MTTPPVRKSIGRSPLRLAFLLIPLALAWSALSPTTQAVSPAPDGGYPNNNTAEGTNALFSLTTGAGNSAIGAFALQKNTTGYYNTASGWLALFNNSTGYRNTATGVSALYTNTTGYYNTATGVNTLYYNTTGINNTAIGYDALEHNTTGDRNTATGVRALFSNTTGTTNTATGGYALTTNTTGNGNIANGYQALSLNTAGSGNIAIGSTTLASNTVDSSGQAGNWNTAIGNAALYGNTVGWYNVGIGYFGGANLTTGSYNIEIANKGVNGESRTIRIGDVNQKRAFIAGISGIPVSGSTVVVNSSGQLGVAASSKKFKEEIKSMDKASEAILSLKPVTFHYKKDIEPEGIPQFGLVAEEVEKVNPALITRDADGKPYTVRYDAVNAMLLNEFLKEHHKVEKLEATVARQQKDFQSAVAEQQKQIKALTSGLEKVSNLLEATKPAPQMVGNNQ
jgi:hypothetical protein